MAEPWRFDESNPYEDVFEEALLQEMSSPDAFDVLRRKLLEIQRDPVGEVPFVVGGKLVYIAKTGAVSGAGLAVPPLLIVYAVDHPKRLIQRVFVARAVDAAPAGSDEQQRDFRRAIEKALSNASGTNPPEQRILFPADRTSIHEAKLEEAVRRARKRAKPR